jgi:hypothetical protein
MRWREKKRKGKEEGEGDSMSEPKRELRVQVVCDDFDHAWHTTDCGPDLEQIYDNTRLATDADLAAMGYVKAPQLSKGPSEMLGRAWAERNGYVKLEGIDVEALRGALQRQDVSYLFAVARQVLAALDGDATVTSRDDLVVDGEEA